MKTYEEMAQSALQRIEDYENNQKNKRSIFKPILSFGIVVTFVFGAFQLGLLENVNKNPSLNIGDKEIWKDRIIINHYSETIMDSNKTNIEVKDEDYVELSKAQLNQYYGVDIFPTVPSDLENWDKKQEYFYGIYRQNKGQGQVYFDQTIVNYSNDDMTRNVNITVSKKDDPIIDFVLDQKEMAVSTISGVEVYLSYNQIAYLATFKVNQTGFVILTDGLSQKEVVAIIKSLVE